MNHTPDTAEIYSSHVPALATLVTLGWNYMPPSEAMSARGGPQGVLLAPVLVEELRRRTFEYKGKTYPLSTNAIDQIVRELSSPALNEGLMTANERIYNALTLGVTVTEFVDGKRHSVTVPIIDWARPLANRFTVTEEVELLATDGVHTRRPDVVGYVNGVPLLVIEAKRPDSGNPNKAMVDEGISQMIRNQGQDEIPQLFAYAQLLVSIGMTDGRYGTTRTPKKFWARWREEVLDEAHFKAIKNQALETDPREALLRDRLSDVKAHFTSLWSEEQEVTGQDRLLISLCSPERLLDFTRTFMLFDRKAGKIAARHQQYFGIKALLERVRTLRPDGGREGGVIWHTTGSGKSFTMVLLCKALVQVAGVVLVRQRPGKGNAVFVTLEDETGITNVVLWARMLDQFRREIMGARLMQIEGLVEKSPEGVVHVVARRIIDRSAELSRLSENHETNVQLARADVVANPQPPRRPSHRHPRDVRILPGSRDFH